MKPANEIWEIALGELQLQVSKPNYDTWLKNTIGIGFQDNSFIIGAPNTFISEWLGKRLHSLINRTLTSIIGKPITVQFIVQNSIDALSYSQSVKQGDSSRLEPAWQPDGGTSVKIAPPLKQGRLNPKYTFSTFIAGESNQLAYATALEVSENPGKSYNPLYIYGDTGLGKTHLLHAIGHTAKINGYRILWTSAEHLTSEFILALKNKETEDFQSKYRSVDVLLVDDFQFLVGKSQTQECFFHIFDDLHNKDCQIVITCDSPPRDMRSFKKKLISRLEWGLIADIKPPDYNTRLAILTHKARQLKISATTDVLRYIATQFTNNIRELEGGLNRVVTYAKLSGANLDIKVAVKALSFLVEDVNKVHSPITAEEIINTVARYYTLPAEALTGQRRDKKTALARQVAMYILRLHNNQSLSAIGKLLGGRDHSTILHGYGKIAEEENSNPQLHQAITEILQEINFHKP